MVWSACKRTFWLQRSCISRRRMSFHQWNLSFTQVFNTSRKEWLLKARSRCEQNRIENQHELRNHVWLRLCCEKIWVDDIYQKKMSSTLSVTKTIFKRISVWYLSLKLFHAKSNDIVSNIFGHHLICFYALWCSPAWYKLSQFKRWCCNPHEKSRNDAVLPFIHVHHVQLYYIDIELARIFFSTWTSKRYHAYYNNVQKWYS